MPRSSLACFVLLAWTGAALAGQPAGDEEKRLGGMAIVGNDDAPKSLVIVPWKSARLGPAVGTSSLPDDGREPVDRDVFRRELDYYEIRAASPEARGRSGP